MESTTFNGESSIGSRPQSIGSQSFDESIENSIGSKTRSLRSVSTTSSSKKKNEPKTEIDLDVESDVDIDCNINDDRQNWWEESVIKYAFNLPTVRANLRRLVGTEEVELNDHQFMMNIRTSVWNHFDENLTDRVRQREANEIERSKQLILKCKYNRNNCPKKLLPLHSTVLALDLQSEQTKLHQPMKTDESPVFNINKKTNTTVHLRRKKLKSIRKTNFECLMRQVLKDSKELEYDDSRAVQAKIKSIHDSIREQRRSKRFALIARFNCKGKS